MNKKKSPCISLIWFWYSFSKGQRGCNGIKIVYISNFSQFLSRGWVIENQCFPIFKIVQIILGWGARKLWTFSTICDISFLDCSPNWFPLQVPFYWPMVCDDIITLLHAATEKILCHCMYHTSGIRCCRLLKFVLFWNFSIGTSGGVAVGRR